MRVVKGGIYRVNPQKMIAAFYEPILETCMIAAKRAEFEAKELLRERMLDEKSSGTLEESIIGITDIKPNAIIIALMASAVETGQWEEMQDEPEEADKARGKGNFDYALAVELGTGEFREDEYGTVVGEPIEANPDFVFWMGEYTDKGNRSLIRLPVSAGQPALHYLRDALLIIQPQIDEMLNKVFNKVNVDSFLEIVK